MNGRLDRLRAVLEEPFLVTNPVNLQYLTGVESDNAGLLVEPDRTRFFTDFRYVEAAKAAGTVEVVQTARNVLADLAERLSGRIGFEAETVTYAGYETLAAGNLVLVPRRGTVQALRTVKEDGELAAIRRAAAVTTETFERLSDQPFAGRTERDLADWIEGDVP